jgi:mannose-6-phosphate isomerase-like protein (cupin superfamily)
VYLITGSEAPRFQLPGVEFTALAAPSRGSTDLCTWQITVEPALRSDQSHTLDHDEIFMVTAGALQLSPDGPVVRTGDAAVVPAGTPIQLVNPGTEPARAYVAIRAGFTPTMADGSVLATPPWAA